MAAWFEVSDSAARLSSMEGLRGFSAAIVFFVHFHALFEPSVRQSAAHRISEFAASFGHTGVDVFFVLSGFLIYGIVLQKRTSYFSFMRRRVVRLYPVFLFVFSLYLVVSLFSPQHSKLPRENLVGYLAANFFMLPGMFPIAPLITPAWSLSYELFFYATLPIAVGALRLRQWSAGARIILFSSASACHLGASWGGASVRTRLVMFVCGMLVWEMKDWPVFRRFAAGQYAALAAFAATLAVFGRSGGQVVGSMGALSGGTPAMIGLLFLSTGWMVLHAFQPGGFLWRLFSWDYLRWGGNMSYSYYLIHGITLHFVREVLRRTGVLSQLSAPGYVALGVVCFGVTLVSGAFLFLVVEKPCSLTRRRALSSAAAQK